MNATNIIFAKCCRFDTDASFCTPINRHIDTTNTAVCTTTSSLAYIFIISLFSANHNSIIIIHVDTVRHHKCLINRIAHGNIGIGGNRVITVLMVSDIGKTPTFGLSLGLHSICSNVLPTLIAHILNVLFIAIRVGRGTLSNRYLICLPDTSTIATGTRSLIFVYDFTGFRFLVTSIKRTLQVIMLINDIGFFKDAVGGCRYAKAKILLNSD
jgi:hypothetical protein